MTDGSFSWMNYVKPQIALEQLANGVKESVNQAPCYGEYGQPCPHDQHMETKAPHEMG